MRVGRSVSIIKKNFKLLIRSKASAFIVLIGPLLIILLVGLAFSGKTSYELSVGYYAPDYNNLTNAFIDGLKQSKYYVQEFKDEQTCVHKIEQGIIHTCIIFPKNFQISNEKTNELRFLVDYSRMNLVYKIINSVSETLEIESKELSYSLTQLLLSKINNTIDDINADLILLSELNPKINLLMLDLQKAKSNTEAMKLETRDVRLSGTNKSVILLNKTILSLEEQGFELINKTQEYLEILVEDYEHWGENRSEEKIQDFEKLKNKTITLYNETHLRIQETLDAIEKTSSSISQLESDLNMSKQLNKKTQERIESAKNNLADIQSSVSELRIALERSKHNLAGISVTSAETIVSPVNTRIEPVVSETSKQVFMFPFILVLVIMFVALLLSSTLILFEKNSKAFFRNSITPTTHSLFIITTFITSFTVIILQTFIILWLANYFLHIPLFKNVLSTLLIILVTTTFFIILGMIIGYLFSTQEGAIMASIVIGAVLMFLSNLVIPLETLAPGLSGIVKYNPYVLASELLRKSLLFRISFQEVLTPILILFGAALIIFLVMILLHALLSRKRIKKGECLS